MVLFTGSSQPIQPDVVEIHRSCSACGGTVLRAEADCKSVNIGKVHSLVGKCLQVDYPLRSSGLLYRCGIVVIDHHITVESNIHPLGGISRRSA